MVQRRYGRSNQSKQAINGGLMPEPTSAHYKEYCEHARAFGAEPMSKEGFNKIFELFK